MTRDWSGSRRKLENEPRRLRERSWHDACSGAVYRRDSFLRALYPLRRRQDETSIEHCGDELASGRVRRRRSTDALSGVSSRCPGGQSAASPSDEAEAAKRVAAAGAESRSVTVNGVKLHYLYAGKGPPVVLLHGYAETSHMWLPLIAELAKTHTVIVPDLRGAGAPTSPRPATTRRHMAQDIHALAAVARARARQASSGTTSA